MPILCRVHCGIASRPPRVAATSCVAHAPAAHGHAPRSMLPFGARQWVGVWYPQGGVGGTSLHAPVGARVSSDFTETVYVLQEETFFHFGGRRPSEPQVACAHG